MSDPERNEIEQALARFLDDEPEPTDGERLADAIASDEAFEREVLGMLIVDELLRQNSLPDDRAFVESLNLRLDAEIDADAERSGFFSRFTQRFNGRVSAVRRGRPSRAVFGMLTAAAILICTLSAALLGYRWRGPNPQPPENLNAARVAP